MHATSGRKFQYCHFGMSANLHTWHMKKAIPTVHSLVPTIIEIHKDQLIQVIDWEVGSIRQCMRLAKLKAKKCHVWELEPPHKVCQDMEFFHKHLYLNPLKAFIELVNLFIDILSFSRAPFNSHSLLFQWWKWG